MSEPLDFSLDADGGVVIELRPLTRLSALSNQAKQVLDAAVDTSGSSFSIKVSATNLKDEIPCRLDAMFGKHPHSWNGSLKAVAGSAEAAFWPSGAKSSKIELNLAGALIFGKGTVELSCTAQFAEPEKLALSYPVSFSNPFDVQVTHGSATSTIDMGEAVVRRQLMPVGKILLVGTPIQLKPTSIPEAWKNAKLEMALRIPGKDGAYLINWTPLEKDKFWPPTPFKLGLKPDLHLDPALANARNEFDLELCLRNPEKKKNSELFSIKLCDPIPKPTLTYGSLYKPVVIAVKSVTKAPPAKESREESLDPFFTLKIGNFFDAIDSFLKIDAFLCTSSLEPPPSIKRSYTLRKSSRTLENASTSNPLALELTGNATGCVNKLMLGKLQDATTGADVAFESVFLMFHTLPMHMKSKDGIKNSPLLGLYDIAFAANAFTPVDTGIDKNCHVVSMSDTKIGAATQGMDAAGAPVTIFQYIPAPAKPVTEKKAEPKAKDKKAPTTKAKT
ncbi:MAG: hypothetical protein IPK50_02840 [Fibrobacterota bacterium]|nr:hypothetical protein [Fibrobacterota bacterium]QQS05834.1 MAG: hypothetical protein IPK50_02840 [Fibrobacterota bacterium]